MIYIGIDPGKNGGYAFIQPNNKKDIVIVKPFNEINYIDDLEYNKSSGDDMICCIEKVGAMPGQGVVSMFNFGQNFGFLKGVLEAYHIPYQEVRPQTWKKEFNLSGRDKQASIKVCQHLYPDISLLKTDRCKKPSDGMAEALLMATYAYRRL